MFIRAHLLADLHLHPLQYPRNNSEILLDRHDPAVITLSVGDRVLARLSEEDPAPGEEDAPPRFRARLIRRFNSSPGESAVGQVQKSDRGLVIEPISRKRSRTVPLAPSQDTPAKPGDIVRYRLKAVRRYAPELAEIIDVLGTHAGPRSIGQLTLAEHDIDTEFPAQVLADAEAVKPPSPAARTDWRNLPFVTIDPADAKDHDDAVFAESDPGEDNAGGWKIYVAIADVAGVVRPGSALDREARQRGNSVYLPDQVVPMLPERISNDLCSLRDHEDRAVLGVCIRITAKGVKISHRFYRAMIHSQAKLSYQTAQSYFSAPSSAPEPLQGPLSDLFSAYQALVTARTQRQPLDLELTERKLSFNAEGEVSGFEEVERLDAHRLIEEMMILANVAAAESLQGHPAPLLRVHDSPGLDNRP